MTTINLVIYIAETAAAIAIFVGLKLLHEARPDDFIVSPGAVLVLFGGVVIGLTVGVTVGLNARHKQ